MTPTSTRFWMPCRKAFLAMTLLAAAALAQPALAQVMTTSVDADPSASAWGQWRGAARDGQVSGTGWADNLDGLRPAWRVELGKGYPGPVVGRDRVFVLGSDEVGTVTVRALARLDGSEIWRKSWGAPAEVPFFAASHGAWVRSTPAYDGEMLFVGDMLEMVFALDGETGDELWRIDLPRHYQVSEPPFGFASSPLLDGDYLYVQAANGIVKLDKRTGVPVWRAAASPNNIMSGGAFSSPVLAELNGQRQLLVFTRAALTGVDPESGAVLWSQSVPNFRGMNIVTPMSYGNGIFVSQHRNGSHFYSVSSSNDVAPAWTSKGSGYMSTPVQIGDYAYLHLGNGRFSCIDLRTGEEKWRTTPFGEYWSIAWQGDKLLALDAEGELRLIRANPDQYELLDEAAVATASAWGHIAVAGEQVFVRELEALNVFVWPSRGTPRVAAAGPASDNSDPDTRR